MTRNVAIEYPAAREVAFVDIGEPPEPGPGELLLRTTHSGITNGTERHALLGEHIWAGMYPSRHGYQQVCVLEAIGPGVAGFAAGEWVFLGQYVGHRAWNLVNVTSDAGHHLCIKLPKARDYSQFALLGVAGVAMRCVRRVRVGPGDTVWVVGLGPIGQFAAQAARAAGARVTVSDPEHKRLEVARQLGAHNAINPGRAVVTDEIRAGGPYSHIIDCSGIPSLLHEVWDARVLAHKGVVALLAVRSETRFPWPMLHGTEASIEVSCHFTLDDLRVLLQLMELGTVKLEPVIWHRMPIAEALEAYRTLRDSPGELLGVVFDWTQSG